MGAYDWHSLRLIVGVGVELSCRSSLRAEHDGHSASAGTREQSMTGRASAASHVWMVVRRRRETLHYMRLIVCTGAMGAYEWHSLRPVVGGGVAVCHIVMSVFYVAHTLSH